jgi:hypothetical protein
MNTALFHLGLVLVTQTVPLSVSELLANPERFNTQPVVVRGTITNFRANLWRLRGSVYMFDLGDGKETIHVITFVKPPCRSGAAIVEGTFEQVKRRVEVSYPFDEITAHKVTCDSSDPKGSAPIVNPYDAAD